jgi:NADPH:quinone reductase-like Zn-dependent oxidoreductase
VLNSLAGEFLAKSLRTLGVCGRFLEIGKRDIYENQSLSLYPFRNNLAFFAIDLEQAWETYPEVVTALNEELMQLFARRELVPLPRRVFPVSEVIEAFRYMRQTKHIGKVVISMECNV